MLITPEIAEKLVLKDSELDYARDFVAIGAKVDAEGIPNHCGIIINQNTKTQLFHFNFGDVKLERVDNTSSNYYYSYLPIIDEKEVLNFLAKCELIVDNEPDLEFGYTYNGEFFNEKGEIIFKLPKNNITNCVFFCISVISGFILTERYFEYNDWKSDNLSTSWFQNVFLKKRKFGRFVAEDVDAFFETVKRIPALDYFSSASINNLPVRKVTVDNYSKFIGVAIKKHHVKVV